MSPYNPYSQMGMGLGMGMGMASMYSPQLFQAPFGAQPSMMVAHQPDWDSEFSKLSGVNTKDKGKGRLVEVADEAGFEEAFKNLEVAEKDESKGNLDDYMSGFEK